MKYLKIFEDFNESKPSSITIEVSEDFIKEKKLYKANSKVEMRPGLYYNLGNTKYEINKPSEFFFAVYLPDVNEIQYFELEVDDELNKFRELADERYINENQLKSLVQSGIRYIPLSYSKFGKGFQIGEIGDRGGYFKIIDVKK